MKSALIVVDVQRSFTRRPYWTDVDVPDFLRNLQLLVDRATAARVPVLQVFHAEEDEGPTGPFSRHSGDVVTLAGLRLSPDEVFYKSVHSALYGKNASGETVEQWLRRNQIRRVVVTGIRTEQCCETTTRHASDVGFKVDYAIDATLTFPMVSGSGRTYSARDIADRTELVLSGRFADVLRAAAVAW